MHDNNQIILNKSKQLALEIVDLCISKNYPFIVRPLIQQLIKAGTSVGANVREARFAYTKDDFYYKLNIALKEAGETQFWLEILCEKDIITKAQFDSCYNILNV